MADRVDRKTRSRIMTAVRTTGTGPEFVVQRIVKALRYKFQVNQRDLPGNPDIVLPSVGAAIFVHGCFWHGHADCRYARLPKSNLAYWEPKIARTMERDREQRVALRRMGWRVLAVWQCELKSPDRVARRLRMFLKGARSGRAGSRVAAVG